MSSKTLYTMQLVNGALFLNAKNLFLTSIKFLFAGFDVFHEFDVFSVILILYLNDAESVMGSAL